MDLGLIALKTKADATAFLKTCGQLRVWDRELKIDLDAAAFLEPEAA
jgi:catalase